MLLDFYADWCEPCKILTPKLEKLVGESQGAVRLAKVNVDKLPELAQAVQVKSLPTVMLVFQGKLADSFQGVRPDAQLKAFVDKAVALGGGGPGAAAQALEDAEALLDAGDVPGATQAYAQLAGLPEHAAAASAGLAMCALKDGDLAMAQDLIAQVHKQHPEDLSKPLVRKAISTIELAAEAPGGEGRSAAELRALLEEDPQAHAVRFELAQALLASGDSESAVSELLLILKRDKRWENGSARDLLLKLFDSLGSDHELTKSGRRRLANIMLM